MMTPSPAPFAILLAGKIVATPRLKQQVAGARIIAADGGVAHARALDVEPELWIGDFDSASPELRAAYAHVPTQTYPAAKAETDGALAIAHALSEGATNIVLVGAFGGRTDHTFALLAQACALQDQGIPALSSDGRQEAISLRPNPQTFDYASGTPFSVLAFSDLAGLSLSGAGWPLTNRAVPFGDTLTLSNHVDGNLTASLASGRALLIAQLD